MDNSTFAVIGFCIVCILLLVLWLKPTKAQSNNIYTEPFLVKLIFADGGSEYQSHIPIEIFAVDFAMAHKLAIRLQKVMGADSFELS